MRGVSRLLFMALVFIPSAASPQGGNPIGSEFRVNTYTTDAQRRPAVAADPAGNFVIVWMSHSQDGEFWDVFGQRYASTGAPLGPEFRVNTYTTSDQSIPAVASDSSGNFVVVWQSLIQDGSSYSGVFAQRFASTGAPLGTEFRVNTYTTSSQDSPTVASDASGNFVVVWQSFFQDGSNSGVFAQRYASTGAPLGAEFRVNTHTTDAQALPAVASDPSGNFVVVWESEQDGSGDGIFAQRFASTGAPLGPEFRVNSYTTNSQFFPAVAQAASGNFVVVWGSQIQDGSEAGVFGQRYDSTGAPLGAEFRVNSYTPSDQYSPVVASDSSDNFVVVWLSSFQDGSWPGVFGQRYASTGEPLGPEFRVNTYTTDFQESAAVASDSSGNFVVVWTSHPGGPFPGQDGSFGGVFGQRFRAIVPVELTHFGVE